MFLHGCMPILSAGQDNIKKDCEKLKKLGYNLIVFCDSDRNGNQGETDEKNKEELIKMKIPVCDYDKGLSIEEQLFKDLPKKTIEEIMEYVYKDRDKTKTPDKEAFLENIKKIYNENNEKIENIEKFIKIDEKNNIIIPILEEHPEKTRKILGYVSKKLQWFKYETMGRKIYEKGIYMGTPALTKGLEFDNVIILDAEGLDKNNLYVAMTRSSKKLYIISSKETLPSTQKKEKKNNENNLSLSQNITKKIHIILYGFFYKYKYIRLI